MKINLPVKKNLKKKETYNSFIERDRTSDFTKDKAINLISNTIHTAKNDELKIDSKDLNQKINKDLAELSLVLFKLIRDLKIKNSSKNDENK